MVEQLKWFGELMAVMHHDGGHYLAEHGPEKAAEDALNNWYALEAQLTDEKMLREAQENALNQCCKRRALLEAQCAAMWEALHINNCWLEASLTCESHVWDSDQREAADHCLQKGKEALSPDAGRKVLDVVRAVIACDMAPPEDQTNARGHLTKTIRVLGWEP